MRRTAMGALVLAALGMVLAPGEARSQVNVSVSIGGFYDELSPYGDWVDCRWGGCWVPRGMGAGWQPYVEGEWIYTSYGWTWVSSDPWGGDPYHYGTWDFIEPYGWVWVPGTVWAPAWVTWSYSNSYVGWAPMPPSHTFGRSGYSGRAIVLGQERYVYVPTNRFVGTNVRSVRLAPQRNPEVFRQARSATRFDVSGGIVRNTALPLETVQRSTQGRIATREISTARTTPRTLASGGFSGSGSVAIVAPPQQVKAARASRPQPAQQPHAQQQPAQQRQPAQQQQQQPQQHPKQQPQQQPAPVQAQQHAAQQQAAPRAEPHEASQKQMAGQPNEAREPGKDRQASPSAPKQQQPAPAEHKAEPRQQPPAQQHPQQQPQPRQEHQQQQQPQAQPQPRQQQQQQQAPAAQPAQKPHEEGGNGKPAGQEQGKGENKGENKAKKDHEGGS